MFQFSNFQFQVTSEVRIISTLSKCFINITGLGLQNLQNKKPHSSPEHKLSIVTFLCWLNMSQRRVVPHFIF